jgi:acyl dehydratase
LTQLFDIGKVAPFHAARDPVNIPTIRRWGDAVGDRNPVHTDPDVAARSRFRQVVAPLTMLDVWTKPGLAYQRDLANPQGHAFEILDRSGFTSAVAVSSELRHGRHLVLGEVVTSAITLEDVSPEKATALGNGHFVTTRQDFFVGDAPVGSARFTVMRYRPAGERRTAAQRRPAGEHRLAGSVASPDQRDVLGTVTASGVSEGQVLPEVVVPITSTLIVSGALLTSDYFEGHHDRAAAQRLGSRDIFMNIHTTLGVVESYVGGWLGPNAEWRSISVRLGVPNYPGDDMHLEGEVASIHRDTGAAAIAFRGTNSLGVHVSGKVEVVVPA